MTTLPEQFGFTTTFFELPGLRLHAAVAGPANGPLVVLLHGFPEFWYEWRHIMGPLAAAGFRVIAPDQRGYNLTGKAGPYDLRTVAADVVNLIAAAGYESAHIVGHDWGGAVAWAVAAWHPRRVQRLVVVNLPHPLALADALAHVNLRQYLRSTYVAFFQLPRLPEWLLSRDNFAVLKRTLRSTSEPGAFPAADLDRYVEAWSQPGALSAMLGWYRAVWRSRAQVLASRPEFDRIFAPALLLWGERDAALGVELAEASVPHMADGRLVRFPEASHWLPAEAPGVVSRHLLDHLSR
jgi:pimeloyl-ACP methyl ester carboxylesterase